MRTKLALVFLLSSTAACWAQAGAPAAPAPAPFAQQYDAPTNTPQYVTILTRDFAPGATAGKHLHHGVEMTIVIRGDLELEVDGSAPHVYHAGQSFIVPRDKPHDAKNVGTTPVTLAVTYVLDKGTPLRVPVK